VDLTEEQWDFVEPTLDGAHEQLRLERRRRRLAAGHLEQQFQRGWGMRAQVRLEREIRELDGDGGRRIGPILTAWVRKSGAPLSIGEVLEYLDSYEFRKRLGAARCVGGDSMKSMPESKGPKYRNLYAFRGSIWYERVVRGRRFRRDLETSSWEEAAARRDARGKLSGVETLRGRPGETPTLAEFAKR
jgi:hypothetical protein